uniref:CUB domain-containing protein n=1 Tax=Panagrellus redivivus TaxID=6233 RepID=A0A7E4ZZ51_PANRE
MSFATVLICLSVVLSQVSAELVLEKDVTETVTFDGSELEIEVDNSGGIGGVFTLCIKSSEQFPSPDCPTGYLWIRFSFGRIPDVKLLKMDRQGKVMMGTAFFTTIKAIAFNDEALEVILKEVPDQSTKVWLLNAVRYVPPEPVETTTPKKSDSMAVFSVVIIVLLAIAGLLIAGLVVLICYCRRRTPQKMEQSDDRGQKHKTTGTFRDDGPSAPLPPKPKSRRTSSTTVTTTTLPVKFSSAVAVPQSRSLTTIGEPTLSPDTRALSSAPALDNAFPHDSTKESESFTVASGRRSKSAL